MTWAEFCLRLNAYQRLDKKDWYKVRLLAYQTYVSNWQNPKKKPVNIDVFLPLDEKEKPRLNEVQQTAIQKAQEQYYNRKNGTT